MQIKNEQLLIKLMSDNVILKTGCLNTRWKIMMDKLYPGHGMSSRFMLFSTLWTIEGNTCQICGATTTHKFLSPNFITGEKAFANTCSILCGKVLKSKKLVCSRNDNLKEIIRVEKFKKTVSKVNANGEKLSVSISKKAAETKRNTIINGKSVLEHQIIKTKNTKITKGIQMPDENISPFHLYRKTVHRLSSKEPLHTLENVNLRGHFNNNGYHLDHILSIKDGFRFGIPPEIIASIVNLRFVPAIENYSKGGKSDQLLGDLIRKYFEYKILKLH